MISRPVRTCVDDQYTTEKSPEVKYWRLGDSFLDTFTYYSETGLANVNQSFTNFTPAFSGLQSLFNGVAPEGLYHPVVVLEANETFRQYYLSRTGGRTTHVLRGDTRQELDMPLQIGDAKFTPYATGQRDGVEDQQFPEPDSAGGNTTRLWGLQVGARGRWSSGGCMTMWNRASGMFIAYGT